jgi:hypothetical protein
MSHIFKMSNNSYEFNLYDNSCNSFANFMLFNKSKSKNKAIDLIQIKTNKTNKKDQSFNTIDLNPTFSEQFKSKSNSKEDKLLDHLHSSNFLKRKNTLLVNHLKNNQLLTDEDYVTDLEFYNNFENILKNNQNSIDSLRNGDTKNNTTKLISLKQNFMKSCSCTDLSSDSCLSNMSSNDFYYETRNSNYLESLARDKPTVIYSMYSTPPNLKRNNNNENFILNQSTDHNSVSSIVLNKRKQTNKRPKTSTRKTKHKNLNEYNTSNKFEEENYSEIKSIDLFETKNESKFDLVEWTQWRKQLNDYLIAEVGNSFEHDYSDLIDKIETENLFSIINYLRSGFDKKAYKVYGIPRVKLNDYEKISLKSPKITTGVNVKEKIKAFEKVAISNQTIGASQNKVKNLKKEQNLLDEIKAKLKHRNTEHIYYNENNNIFLKPKIQLSK